jgi:hypothetical protein
MTQGNQRLARFSTEQVFAKAGFTAMLGVAESTVAPLVQALTNAH